MPVAYDIFLDSALTNLLATIPAYNSEKKFEFIDYSVSKRKTTYFVVSVDQFDNQSHPVSVTIGPERRRESNYSCSRNQYSQFNLLLPKLIN